jgi:hypothetical protein
MRNKWRVVCRDFAIMLIVIMFFLLLITWVNSGRSEIACRQLGYDYAVLVGPEFYDADCVKEANITRVPLRRSGE